MTDPTPDDLIAEQATEAPPSEPVPDAADLPSDVKDGLAGEPDPDSPDADDGSDESHREDAI